MKKKWIVTTAIVLALAGTGVACREQIKPYMTRILFGISDYFRDRGLESPAGIVRIDDQVYGTDKMQVFDVYYPEGTDGPLPTIVSIHGGGYTYGDKELYQYYCMDLARRGFAVVNFSYRLAPEHKFPAPLEDLNSVMWYVCADAVKYHVDTENIFFVGDSAGAHLNAQYTTAVSNPEYAARLSLQIPSFTLRATALNCGLYRAEDLEGNTSYYLAKGQDLGDLDMHAYITDKFPPAYVMSGTEDFALPYAEPMAAFLKEKGVECELHIFGDEQTKAPHVFHLNMKSALADQCNDAECAFFRAYSR